MGAFQVRMIRCVAGPEVYHAAMTAPFRGVFGIVEEDRRLLMVANQRDLGEGPVLCWDVPGGGVESGESLLDALRREMREETGLVVEPLDLAFLIERFGFRGREPEIATHYYFFNVRVTERLDGPTDPKIVDLRFLSPEEIETRCTQAYHREFLTWLAGGRRRRYFLDRSGG